jgi:hypothetical protein
MDLELSQQREGYRSPAGKRRVDPYIHQLLCIRDGYLLEVNLDSTCACLCIIVQL